MELDRGEIIAVRSYAFDSPVERVIEEGSRKVSWISSTAGDADGIILTLTPYYVRVLQLDGAKAWSSPIWISRL